MRLRQLARKLDVNPSRLLDILSENGHSIENDPNFKLTEEQEQLITTRIASKKVEIIEVIEEAPKEVELEEEVPTPKKKVLPKKIELKEPKVKKVEAPKIYSLEKEIEEKTKDIELIKAPKLKLDGLKVLGKIDLPAPKQKPVKEEKEAEDKAKDVPKARRNNISEDRKPQPERKPRPNSIELERRRIEREAKQKREAEEKHLKALKEKHYKETVLAKQKANAAKKKKKSAQPLTPKAVTEEPKINKPKAQKAQKVVKKKTVLGRFWAWLNGAYDNY
ncbi:MAG: hypothetical protein COW03_06375 [Cytophagales bacterium CG12_big_fil_rev_8_21_14_0_65_40_12]|nr:MAG: hypothetical protein COW03_06375 [Cytophagales bacterium CG12_big_fil_rev_8_21_14_0_65_40_12]PIW03274.1 MAG: hypothetical protein COW40_15530 [Cytophagales bacterium CG17_big_fil_post_rev_8_21_14_2_50_40_13]